MEWAAGAWLVLLGVAAIVVGGHDTAVGRQIDVRLTGSAVLAAGVVLVAGAHGLYRGHPRGHALASVAALLGVALGIFTFVTQTVNDDPDGRLVWWGGIIVLSLAAFSAIRLTTPEAERETGILGHLPVLKSAVSLGLLLSAAQFWHSAIYLPTRAPVNVTIKPEFEPPERRGDRFLVRGKVTVENPSGARVIPVASSLTVSANRIARKVVPTERFDHDARDADAGKREEAVRMPEQLEPPVAITRGRFVGEDDFFEPDHTFTRPFIAWFPAEGASGRYEIARVDVGVAIARPTVEVLEDPEAVRTESTDDATVITRSIPEDGWLHDLTRGERYVVATYYVTPWAENNEFVPFTVGFNRVRSPDPPSDFNDRMERFYGLNFIYASAAVPLPK